MKTLADKVSVQFVIHPDHGDSIRITVQRFKLGCTSVMYVGSIYKFDETAYKIKKIVEIAHLVKYFVQEELEIVGGH